MRMRGLTRTEKLSATIRLQDIEGAMGSLLMEVLNGKVAAQNLDRLTRLERQVRRFRWKLEAYPELAE